MKKGEKRKRATRESEITAALATLGKKINIFCIRGLDKALNASETLQRWELLQASALRHVCSYRLTVELVHPLKKPMFIWDQFYLCGRLTRCSLAALSPVLFADWD